MPWCPCENQRTMGTGSFLLPCSGNWIQVIRLDSNCLYILSHIVGPKFEIIKNKSKLFTAKMTTKFEGRLIFKHYFINYLWISYSVFWLYLPPQCLADTLPTLNTANFMSFYFKNPLSAMCHSKTLVYTAAQWSMIDRAGAIPLIKTNSVSLQLSVANSSSARGVTLCQHPPSYWDFIRLEFV